MQANRTKHHLQSAMLVQSYSTSPPPPIKKKNSIFSTTPCDSHWISLWNRMACVQNLFLHKVHQTNQYSMVSFFIKFITFTVLVSFSYNTRFSFFVARAGPMNDTVTESNWTVSLFNPWKEAWKPTYYGCCAISTYRFPPLPLDYLFTEKLFIT